MKHSFLFGAVLIVGVLAVVPAAQDAAAPPAVPALPIILARAATYLEDYATSLSGVVVEEAYVQDVRGVQDVPLGNRFGLRGNSRSGPVHRTLRSDLLLVRPEGSEGWIQFRDVFEVDGKAVRDRDDRLGKLFLQPSKSATEQTAKIIKESARYNIGDIERTINIPVLAMTVLDRHQQAGFQFEIDRVAGDRAPALPKSAAFAIQSGAVVIGFEETQMRTMITTREGKNLRSHGRFWLAMPTAEVLMTELQVEDFSIGATIHVAYQRRPGINVPVPVEMHEVYENHQNTTKVEGTATYSNFREFNVKVDEEIAPIR